MSTTTSTPTLKDVLDTADPTTIADAERLVQLGTALGLLPVGPIPVTITAGVVTLPTNRKAPINGCVNVFVTAGTNKGFYTFKGYNTTPTTLTYTVTPDGNLLFDASDDAPTAAEITYHPVQGTLITETLTVASHAVTLKLGKAQALISVTNQGGTAKTCDTSRGGSPSNGHAAISYDGTQIAINASDTSTALTVVYIALPGSGTAPTVDTALSARLETSEDLF